MNSHVFLNEGCRLIAFCPATVGAHAVCYEECSRTEFQLIDIRMNDIDSLQSYNIGSASNLVCNR